MAEAASVFASVVPSLRGWSTKLSSGLRKERTQNVDVDVTPKVDAKALNKAETEVRAAADRVARARKAEEDAAGRVRVAEAALADERSRSAAGSARVVAAEERLAKASRDSKAQRDGLVSSENKLAAARAKVAALKSEGDRQITLDVDADTSRAKATLAAFVKWASTGKIEKKVDVDTGPAIIQFAALGRALKGIALPAGAIAAAPFLLSLAGNAAQAAGAIALVPAAMGIAGVAVATLKIGFSGFGDAMKYAFDPTKADKFAEAIAKMPPPMRDTALAVKALNPQLTSMRQQVQSAMFAGMASEVKSLGGLYLPMLGNALAPIAAGFNQAAHATFGWLQSTYGISAVRTILDSAKVAIGNITAAIAPVITSLITIGAIGAPILAQLTDGAGAVAGRFASWVGSAQGIQTITGMIYNAMNVIGQLYFLARNVGSIMGSLFSGGMASGQSFLDVLVNVTGALATALRTPEGAGALALIMTVIRDIVGALWDKIVILWPAIQSLVGAFGMLLQAAAPISLILVNFLAPVLQVIGIGLQALAPILGPLIGLWILWNSVMAITNLIMSMNPIVLVVLAIAALVGAVIYAYQNFAWFRDIVQGAWAVIQNVATNAWIGLQQIFTGLTIAVQAVGAFFVWLWQSVIVPAWQAIAGAISWAWSTVIWPVLQAIGTGLAYLGLAIVTLLVTPFYLAWQAIAAIATWAWTAILQPIWQGAIQPALQTLGGFFTWLWQGVIVPVWNGIVLQVQIAWIVISAIFNAVMAFIRGVLAATWNWLLNAVIMPVWNGIKAAIAAAWAFIQNTIFNPIMAFIRGPLNDTWQWLWHSVIEPVWNGIKAAIQGAWSFIQGVFDTGKAAVNAVGQAFQFVADWVARTWAGIKESARAPIQFVVDIVYNNGIRNVWNGIAGLFGMAQLPAVHFATGGVLPGYTPGRDMIPAMLSGGEGILVPEAVRGLGPAFVGWANRTFSGGRSRGGAGTPQQGGRGYSTGGIAHFADGGVLGGIGDFFSGAAGFFTKVFTDPAGAVRDLFSSITGDAGRTPGGGQPWTEGIKGVVPKTIDAVIEKVKKWVESLAAGGGDWTGVISAALAMMGQPQTLIPVVHRRMMQESGGNPTIVNTTDSNWQKGTPSVGLMQVIGPTYRSNRDARRDAGPYLYGVSVDPLSNMLASMHYALGRYGSLAAAYNKAGGYDSGGLASGSGLLLKQAISPERVLSPRQTAAFESIVPMLSSLRSGSGSTGYGAADFERGGGGGSLIDTLEQHFHGDAAGMSGQATRDLTHSLRVIKRGGRP